MANRKYGGRTWSPETDFKVSVGKPYAAEGNRGSDADGFRRGAQSQGSDDATYLRPSSVRDDGGSAVRDIYADVMNAPQGSGSDITGGGGPVYEVGGGSGPARYAPKSAAQAHKDQK